MWAPPSTHHTHEPVTAHRLHSCHYATASSWRDTSLLSVHQNPAHHSRSSLHILMYFFIPQVWINASSPGAALGLGMQQ